MITYRSCQLRQQGSCKGRVKNNLKNCKKKLDKKNLQEYNK